MRPTLLLAALLLASLGIPALADIQIGAAAPLSGANAPLGEQLRRGVQLAVDDINAAGGIGGQHLTVTFADDGCDPRKAVDVATGFVSAGVSAVIGHYCSGASIPASKVYAKAGILEISPASTHPKYTDEGPWNVIRLVPRDDAQGVAAARLVLAKFPAAKVAILNDQTPADAAIATRFRETLAAAGVAPVTDETYKPGAKAYGDLAQKIQSANADVVYIAGSYVEGGIIAKSLRDAGSTAQFIATDALVTEDFATTAKDAAEGTLMTFTFDPRKAPVARALLDRMKASDINAEGFTLYAYAAVQAFASAAEATGGTDGTRMAEWLRGGSTVSTILGSVSFDAKGDLKAPRIAWFRWIDGRIAEVDPATLLPPEIDTTP